MKTKNGNIISLDIIPCYVLQKKDDVVEIAATYLSPNIVIIKWVPSILFEGIKEKEKAFLFIEIRPGIMEHSTISAKGYRKSFFWLKDFLNLNKTLKNKTKNGNYKLKLTNFFLKKGLN